MRVNVRISMLIVFSTVFYIKLVVHQIHLDRERRFMNGDFLFFWLEKLVLVIFRGYLSEIESGRTKP